MSDRKWENMSDTEFEAMLESSVSEIPPEDIVAGVTPWKKSINRVLAGIALTTIIFHFRGLDYILPAIGMVLLLLGFRTLRRENKWFGSCFVVSVMRALYFFPSLILNTTIMQNAFHTSGIASVLTALNLLLLFLEFVCLWRGFLSVQQKAGIPPHADGAVVLMVWYALMCLLALIQYRGLILAVLMVVGYIFIIYSLYQLSKELEEAGYAIKTAPLKTTDRCIVISLAVILLVGGACGYVFGGSYPMEWSALPPAEHKEVEDIKAQLTGLGFPEYVLDDLSAADIAACNGASQVVVKATDVSGNDGSVKITEYGSGNKRHSVQNTVYDVKGLLLTGVSVQIPGSQERWMIFHHFLWTTDPGFYGTESIQLWPVYRNIAEGWRPSGALTGRILYDDNGETFVADYYSLGPQTVTSNSIFWGSQSNTDVFATFSMPRSGHSHRGYVAYSVDKIQDGSIISSWFNYTHQQSWMQYPVMTAIEKRMATNRNDAGVFQTIQDVFQFYPTDGSTE